MTDTPYVLRETQGAVARLTLDQPKSRNALSRPMMTALADALDAVAAQANVRAVVLAANGPAFCAGHDLKELQSLNDPEVMEALFSQCSDLMLKIQSLHVPVIAEVHAMATAAGCQLVATCDLAVAAPDARFATPGVNIGLFCSTPMVALSRAVPRKQAMRMLMTGEPISAQDALGYGLVSDVVADAVDLTSHTMDMAAKIAAKSGRALTIGKEAFYRQAELPVDQAYRYASGVMAKNLQTADADEGICAFIEKRHATWRHE